MTSRTLQYFILCLLLVINSYSARSQDKTIHSIYLIGNLSEIQQGGGSLSGILASHLKDTSANATMLVLGDNLTENGVPDSSDISWGNSVKATEYLEKIINGFQGNTYIIPGDKDWQNGGKHGWAYIENQQRMIDTIFQSEEVEFIPKSGCPGPEEIFLNEEITLMIVDSQWILHAWDKPGKEGDCDVKTTGDLLNNIEQILRRNAHKKVVFAMHHNLISAGKYGTRSFGSLQYLSHPKTKAMSKTLIELLSKYDNVIHVSAQESTLQYLVAEGTPYIISGATKTTSKVKSLEELKHFETAQGFSILRFLEDGSVKLEFLTSASSTNPVYNQVILTKPYIPSLSKEYYDENVDFTNQTMITHVSDQYNKDNTWFAGKNYRKVWIQDRSFPVFDIGKEKGGLKIIQRGGGQQTKSLRLEATDGKQYVLRSIEKYTAKAVPEALRGTFAANIIQDQMSASHPFGAFAVPYLADAANVYHTNPKAVYIPKDPRFGIYQDDFAKTICLYEERVAGNQSDAANFGHSKKIISTPKMLLKLYEDNDNYVDQQWLIKSRLFDMFIGDWDRHDDQWRWAQFKDGKGHMYRPIPRDRDQAFFVSEGLLMNQGTRKWGLTKLQGFDHELKWVPGFNFNARYFDRDFANEPTLGDWLAAADSLQNRLSDIVIEQAIKQWPDEIYQHRGAEIVSKLKSQRNNLKRYAKEHYDFLAKEVNVEGSNKKEYFKVERLDDERTRVRMYKSTKKDKKDKKLYDRTFLRSETKEIRLFGLGGKDEFKLSGNVSKGIKVRVIGGTGKDEIRDESTVKGISKKTWVYDTSEGNDLHLGKESKDKTSSESEVNDYSRTAFKYNQLIPIVLASANNDDGLFVGGGFLHTNQGFRKDPYKSSHLLTGQVAFATKAYNFQYKGKFTDVVRDWDLTINVKALAPNFVTNYFGPGNESNYDKDASQTNNLEDVIDFYRTRFNLYTVETYLTKNIGEKISISFGQHWQSFEASDDYDGENRFVLEFANSIGDLDFFEREVFDGIMAKFEYDGRDSKVMPTHGFYSNFDLRGYVGVNQGAKDFSRFLGEVAYYKTFRLPAKVTFATRFGIGHNFGSYEFFQAQVLDGNTNLRGFRKTRFFGDSKLYNNSELRTRLFNFRNKVVPISIGLTVFNDIGRVWQEGENSDKWHYGYGAGLWFAPLNALVLSIDFAASEEEDLIGYFKLGFRF